jgi:nicotinate-nucleotide adenylyltransferase
LASSSASPKPPPASAPIAILGGTFDPVHNAHLALARAALEQLHAAQVLWIPTGRPGYRGAPVAGAEHRVAMLHAALAGEPRYSIDMRELAPRASGYTVDTLGALRSELGGERPIVLLIGDDQLAVLDQWKSWKTLFELAHLAVYPREGWTPQANPEVRAQLDARSSKPGDNWAARPAGSIIPLTLPPLAVSSTDIRKRLSRGDDVSALLPAPVLEYLKSRMLYRNGPT